MNAAKAKWSPSTSTVAGRRLIHVESAHLEKCVELLRSQPDLGAHVSRFHGYTGDDVSFLRHLPEIRTVYIQDGVPDLSAIEELGKLEWLTVDVGLGTLDCAQLHSLSVLRVAHWRADALRGIEGRHVVELYVRGYRPQERTLEPLSGIGGVADLEVVDSNIVSLAGVAVWPKLISLKLGHCRALRNVTDLSAVSDALRVLEITRCRGGMDPVVFGGLRALERLILCDDTSIATVGFLETLARLRELVLLGTEVVDQDLSSILRSASLRRVALDRKKGYRPASEEVERAIARRGEKSA